MKCWQPKRELRKTCTCWTGCGIGGSSIWLAQHIGCKVTGITLSPAQADKATALAKKLNLSHLVSFYVQDYCNTTFANNTFDIVWAIESVCYAESKETFAKEASRILKSTGTLLVADGVVDHSGNNDTPIMRKFLDGMLVNFLETPANWERYCKNAGFANVRLEDITRFTKHSSRRLLYFSIAGYMWALWRKYIQRRPFSAMQVNNTRACWYQYRGMQKGLWKYGILVAEPPSLRVKQ